MPGLDSACLDPLPYSLSAPTATTAETKGAVCGAANPLESRRQRDSDIRAAAGPSHQPPRAWLGLSSSRLDRTDHQLNPLSVRLPALLTSRVRPLGLSSSRLVRIDYLALPVSAAAGPSHQPGKSPEHGWACRAADLIQPTIISILCLCGCRPPGLAGPVAQPTCSNRQSHSILSVQPPGPLAG